MHIILRHGFNCYQCAFWPLMMYSNQLVLVFTESSSGLGLHSEFFRTWSLARASGVPVSRELGSQLTMTLAATKIYILRGTNNTYLQYQPCSARGTRSPPATPQRLQHLTACLIQNYQWGLEICRTLGFWIKFCEVSGRVVISPQARRHCP